MEKKYEHTNRSCNQKTLVWVPRLRSSASVVVMAVADRARFGRLLRLAVVLGCSSFAGGVTSLRGTVLGVKGVALGVAGVIGR